MAERLTCEICSSGPDLIAGVQVRGIYDGICYWDCMACGHRWHRFEESDSRRAEVEEHWARADRGRGQQRMTDD